ncbi:hypothetical protein, partial [Longimicrobium sp.]|uniref:hypothetical protein n=1 Tax=Longimicrobium sp. TaxID=2029185 RepID=UPI002F95FAA1
MSHRFEGRLCGYLCDECHEPMARVRVRLYRPLEDRAADLVAARPKDTFAVLTAEQVEAKEPRLLAEGHTDEEGSFSIELVDDKRYDGGPVEVDVVISRMPGQNGDVRRKSVQAHLTTLAPDWGRELSWHWRYCVPHRFWCALRALFDAWVICGWVGDCKSGKGAAGLTVTAYDADWISDDTLGTAVTDADGHFRIHYSRADFRKTFLSPLINVETPWPPLNSGPDVYFHVAAAGGAVLIDEDKADGHKPGRENVGACLCVRLCVGGGRPGDGLEPDTKPLFTRVGAYRVKPAFNDFTPAGLTTAGEFAFTGNLELNGILPDAQANTAVEYRFTAAENTGAPGAVFNLTTAHLGTAEIGHLQFWYWDAGLGAWSVNAVPFYVNNPGATVSIPQPPPAAPRVVSINADIDADGWVKVPRVNDLTQGGDGRFTRDSDHLGVLRSDQLTHESIDLGALAAGQAVPAGDRRTLRTWTLAFEAREVASHAPVGADSLARIAIINLTYKYTRHLNWAGGPVETRQVVSLNIQELLGGGGGCAKVNDEVHALYTVYHPMARAGRVYFQGNPPMPGQLDLAPIAAGHAVSPAGGHPFDFSAAQPCAYILWLEAT